MSMRLLPRQTQSQSSLRNCNSYLSDQSLHSSRAEYSNKSYKRNPWEESPRTPPDRSSIRLRRELPGKEKVWIWGWVWRRKSEFSRESVGGWSRTKRKTPRPPGPSTESLMKRHRGYPGSKACRWWTWPGKWSRTPQQALISGQTWSSGARCSGRLSDGTHCRLRKSRCWYWWSTCRRWSKRYPSKWGNPCWTLGLFRCLSRIVREWW